MTIQSIHKLIYEIDGYQGTLEVSDHPDNPLWVSLDDNNITIAVPKQALQELIHILQKFVDS
jgi:hypothetical protein